MISNTRTDFTYLIVCLKNNRYFHSLHSLLTRLLPFFHWPVLYSMFHPLFFTLEPLPHLVTSHYDFKRSLLHNALVRICLAIITNFHQICVLDHIKYWQKILAGAVGTVALIPDDTVTNVALQTAIAIPLGTLVPAGLFVGGSIVSKVYIVDFHIFFPFSLLSCVFSCTFFPITFC